MKQKNWFHYSIINLQSGLSKKKRETQMNIRNESSDFSTCSIDIKKIREYFEQLYGNKLDKMDDTNY